MESNETIHELGTGWIEFSERHARASSADFARATVQYFNSTLQPEARQHISHKELLKKFIECFSENFEYEYLRRSVQQGSKVSELDTFRQIFAHCSSKRSTGERHMIMMSRKSVLWTLERSFSCSIASFHRIARCHIDACAVSRKDQ
jgi:gamma-glutamyl-gamma-aminobutyrate hydrolase PuuD